MNKDKAKTGVEGERLAASYLEGKGYEIVERNYRYKHAEVDLIVRMGDWIVFVEVKTRSSSSFGEPESFVSQRKVEKLHEAANEYVYQNDWNGQIRFDIVSVNLNKGTVSIVHLEDAIT